MTDNTERVILQYEVDRPGLSRALQSTEDLQEGLTEIAGEAKKTSKSITELSKQVKDIKRISAIDDVAREMADLAQRTGDATAAAQGLRDMLKDVGATEGEIERAARAFDAYNKQAGGKGKRGSFNFGAASAVASGLGLGDAANAAGLVDDFSQLAGGLGISTAAIAGATVAVAALAASTAIYLDSTKGADQALKGLIASQDVYYKALRENTTKQTELQIKALDQQLADAKSKRSEILDAETKRFAEDQNAFLGGGDLGARIRTGVRQIFNETEEETVKAVTDLNNEISKVETEISRLSGAIENGQFTSADFVADIQDRLDAEKEYSRILEEGTQASIKRRTEELEADNQRRDKAIADTTAELTKMLGNDGLLVLDVLNGKIKEIPPNVQILVDFINKLKEESAAAQKEIDINNKALPIVTLKEFLNNAKTGLDGFVDGVKDFTDKLTTEGEKLLKIQAEQGLRSFFGGIRKGVDAISDTLNQTGSAVSKFGGDIAKIEESAGQKRLQIADRYGKAVEDATRSAVEAAEKALRNLQQANTDALREAGRDSAAADREFANEQFKVQIESQRAERDALVTHLRRIQDIRNSFADQEYEAGFNRDFASLFLIQRRRNAELSQANTEFGRGISDRSTERADAQADAAQERQFERQERAIALSQKLEDLRIGYARELQEAEIARQQSLARARQVRAQELNELSQTLQRELQLRRNAMQQELNLISQGASARMRIEGQTLSNVVRTASQIGSAISNIFGLFGAKRGSGKAFGGSVSPGFAYPVNEPGISSMRESFTAGGRTYPFPQTPGMFIPTQPGTVNANRTPTIVNMPITVNEAKRPGMTANEVGDIADQRILATMGIKR